MSVGAEVTRIVTPTSSYAWLVRAGDIMLDLVVCGGEVIRLDRSVGFATLHTNDIKRFASLRIDDMTRLLGVDLNEVTVDRIYVEIPEETYELLSGDDYALQNSGFSDLMVWVGKTLAA